MIENVARGSCPEKCGARFQFCNWSVYCISEWTAVTLYNAYIPWDLETTPLQVKTDSTAGSNDRIFVAMFDKDRNWLANVGMKFSSPMQYWINYCYSLGNLPVQPPVEVDKIWTITKTDTNIIITCNNVEVLNYLFVDTITFTNCVSRVGGDVVEEIQFRDEGSKDKAFDFYRAGKGLDLIHTTCSSGRFNVIIPWLVQLQ